MYFLRQILDAPFLFCSFLSLFLSPQPDTKIVWCVDSQTSYDINSSGNGHLLLRQSRERERRQSAITNILAHCSSVDYRIYDYTRTFHTQIHTHTQYSSFFLNLFSSTQPIEQFHSPVYILF